MKSVIEPTIVLSFLSVVALNCGDSTSQCTPNDHTICKEGVVYWVDSCGKEGDKAGDCECGCNTDFSGCKEPCDCTPECNGKVCGPDGCGSTCPPGCSAGETCNETTGQCEACTPQCDGKCCGPDGCGETCVDNCSDTGRTCNSQTCECEGVCQPNCQGRECGPDGCGSTCPPGCGAGDQCNETTGQCECIPDCVGKCCGPDSCGSTCPDNCSDTGQTCNTQTCECEGACQPNCQGKDCGTDGCGSTCPPGCDAGEHCNDTSGQCVDCLVDSDCDDNNVCNGSETCSNGVCVGGSPLDCADTNVCTDDTCDPIDGCQHSFNTATCDVGDDCTENDTCHMGSCSGDQIVSCINGDGCCPSGCNENTDNDCPPLCTYKVVYSNTTSTVKDYVNTEVSNGWHVHSIAGTNSLDVAWLEKNGTYEVFDSAGSFTVEDIEDSVNTAVSDGWQVEAFLSPYISAVHTVWLTKSGIFNVVYDNTTSAIQDSVNTEASNDWQVHTVASTISSVHIAWLEKGGSYQALGTSGGTVKIEDVETSVNTSVSDGWQVFNFVSPYNHYVWLTKNGIYKVVFANNTADIQDSVNTEASNGWQVHTVASTVETIHVAWLEKNNTYQVFDSAGGTTLENIEDSVNTAVADGWRVVKFISPYLHVVWMNKNCP